jgi:hypothetical protein
MWNHVKQKDEALMLPHLWYGFKTAHSQEASTNSASPRRALQWLDLGTDTPWNPEDRSSQHAQGLEMEGQTTSTKSDVQGMGWLALQRIRQTSSCPRMSATLSSLFKNHMEKVIIASL